MQCSLFQVGYHTPNIYPLGVLCKGCVGRGITQTFHDEIATELEKKQQELNDRLKLLTSDNKDFQVTASYLLDLAQRAEQLFNESDEGLRQKLLEYVLSNIELKDKRLSYILNDPFKTIVEAKKKSLAAHNSNIWWNFTTKLEPILSEIAEAGNARPARKTILCIF